MVDKGLNLFDECTARFVQLHLSPQEEECTSSLEDSKMYTSDSIANWNKWKWCYSQNKD